MKGIKLNSATPAQVAGIGMGRGNKRKKKKGTVAHPKSSPVPHHQHPPSSGPSFCKHVRQSTPSHVQKLKRRALSCSTCAQNERRGIKGKQRKADDSTERSLWVCLSCGFVLCGRYDEGHAEEHSKKAGHPLVMNTATLSVWCHECDNEISVPEGGVPSYLRSLAECVRWGKVKLLGMQPHELDALDNEFGGDWNTVSTGKRGGGSRGKPRRKDAVTRIEPNVIEGKASFFLGEGGAETGLKGLRNQGNTCFFNSVLQNLAQAQPLYDAILASYPYGGQPGPLSKGLCNFIRTMWSSPGRVITPRELFTAICQKFRGYRQQDAQEVLRYLLDGVRTEQLKAHEKLERSPPPTGGEGSRAREKCPGERVVEQGLFSNYVSPRPVDPPHNVEGNKARASSLFDDTLDQITESEVERPEKGEPAPVTLVDAVFGGVLESTIVCHCCRTRSTVQEPFFDLSVPIPAQFQKSSTPALRNINRPNTKAKGKQQYQLGRAATPSTRKGSQAGAQLSKRQRKAQRKRENRERMLQRKANEAAATAANVEGVAGVKAKTEEPARGTSGDGEEHASSGERQVTSPVETGASSIGGDEHAPLAAVESGEAAKCEISKISGECESLVAILPTRAADGFPPTYEPYGEIKSAVPTASPAESPLALQGGGTVSKTAMSTPYVAESSSVAPVEAEVGVSGTGCDILQCSSCHSTKLRAAYSKKQAKRTDQQRRCSDCVANSLAERDRNAPDQRRYPEEVRAKRKTEAETDGMVVEEDEDVAAETPRSPFLSNAESGGESIVNTEHLAYADLQREHPYNRGSLAHVNRAELSVLTCLASFTDPETLSDENAFLCSECGRRQQVDAKPSKLEGRAYSLPIAAAKPINVGTLDKPMAYYAAELITLRTLELAANNVCDGEPERSHTGKFIIECVRLLDPADNSVVKLHLEEWKLAWNKGFQREIAAVARQWFLCQCEEPAVAGIVDKSSCGIKRKATKQFAIAEQPRVLTIHLKRFRQTLHGVSKLSFWVDFPLELDLTPFTTTPDEHKHTYILSGLSVHSGGINSGHYIAYVRSNVTKRWYYISDSSAKEVPLETVKRSEAYLLFYQRVDL